jgi:K+-transporting ATPase ATPase C chain
MADRKIEETIMKSQLRAAVAVFISLTLVTGVVYPVFMTFIAQFVFPFQANGSVLDRAGKPIGSELIGQQFDDPRYFWGRPSATTPAPYNAAASMGSNLGPTNPTLLKAIEGRVEAMRQAHPDQSGPVPADLVTASGSGLDPHISPAAAEYQVSRVASARGLTVAEIRRRVTEQTEGRTLGLLGEPRVNVLRLNLALDATPCP